MHSIQNRELCYVFAVPVQLHKNDENRKKYSHWQSLAHFFLQFSCPWRDTGGDKSISFMVYYLPWKNLLHHQEGPPKNVQSTWPGVRVSDPGSPGKMGSERLCFFWRRVHYRMESIMFWFSSVQSWCKCSRLTRTHWLIGCQLNEGVTIMSLLVHDIL